MNQIVRIVKLSEAPGAKFPAGNWETFVPGSTANGPVSLPVDYTLDAYMLAPILPGQPMRAYRLIRNDVLIPGAFNSSRVLELIVRTENSVYRVTTSPATLPEPKKD